MRSRPPRRRPRGLLAALAFAAGGCISAGDAGTPAMCEVTADCDAVAGEVCDEGVCYGDPPATRFAAVLVPAEDRTDLAPTELGELAIGPDGAIAGLDFAPAVTIRGRVLLACPTAAGPEPAGDPGYACGPAASIAAQLTVTRASSFAGGPVYSRQVTALAGIGEGAVAFELKLPRDPEASYQVTIVPEVAAGDQRTASVGDGTSPLELAPPRQVIVRADRDRAFEWVLGEPTDLKRIRGCVQNQLGNGAPFAGMRVTALGRWTALGELERASSQAITDADGCFTIRVPIAMRDAFDVVVRPAVDSTLPGLRLYGEVVPDPADGDGGDDGLGPIHMIDPPLLMPNAATPATFRLPVRAPDSGGGQTAVAGADVRLVTVFAMPLQPEAPERVVDVTYEAHATTSGADSAEPGVAELPLYPGDPGQNRLYRATVVPPAGMEFAAAWSVDVSIGTAGGTLESLVLARRVGVTGRFEAARGEPIDRAPVEVRLAPRFGGDDPLVAAAAAAVPVSTTTTEEDGRFFVWLDREILAVGAAYDLEVKPATYAAPRWTIGDVTLGSGVATDLGRLRLPEASYARGTVRDPSGAAVAGAELRLYELPAGPACEGEAADCALPATLRGVFATDDAGVVRPVLPDP